MFTIRQLFANIGRHARRYVPLGLIVLFLLSANLAVRCIRAEANDTVENTLNRYGSEFYLVNLNEPVFSVDTVAFLHQYPFVAALTPAAALHNIERVNPASGVSKYERQTMLIGLDAAALADAAVEGALPAADTEACLNRSYYESLLQSGLLSGIGGTLHIADPRGGVSADFTVVGVLPDTGTPYSNPTDYLRERVYTTAAAVEAFWKPLRFTAAPEHMNDAYLHAAEGGMSTSDLELSYMRVIEGYELTVTLHSYRDKEAFLSVLRSENARPTATSHRANWAAGETVSGIGRLAAPMERISALCGTVDRVTLSVSLSTVLLLTVLVVLERRYEIGILRCLGFSAAGVCVRFTSELALFLTLTVLLSCALGIPAALSLASALSIPMTSEAILRAAAETLLLLFGMGLLSAAAASAAILSRRPMEILNSRT